jgi:cell division protein ZapA
MAKLSIKVVVAGRNYPLTVEESEKAVVEKAAEDINRRIQILRDSYAVKDVQDLLAMTALQIAVKKHASEGSSKTVAQIDLSKPIKALEDLLEELKK